MIWIDGIICKMDTGSKTWVLKIKPTIVIQRLVKKSFPIVNVRVN